MKVCKKCGINKSLELFNKRKESLDGCVSYCKDCQKMYNNTYRINNKEKFRIYSSEYRADGRYSDKISENKKSYYKKNRASINEYKRSYLKNRMKVDPLFKLKYSIRLLIRSSLNNSGYSKSERTESILGCSIFEFKNYLESKFKEGMSWENRSEWHIDHIVPSSWAKTKEDLIKLNHYTNLQPLWKYDNLQKSNKFEG